MKVNNTIKDLDDPNEWTAEQWAMMPVIDGYARELMDEAKHKLHSAYLSSEHIVMVGVYDIPHFGLHNDIDVMFYNPDRVKALSMIELCKCLSNIFHAHAMRFMERHAPPEGVKLH